MCVKTFNLTLNLNINDNKLNKNYLNPNKTCQHVYIS